MDPLPIPPAEEQLRILTRGAVELHPRDDFETRLAESHAAQEPLVVKTGFDPTAPDLHLGHTVLIEKMAQFQRFGHDVVFLVGDYTALIGDPTGRNAMRPPLSDQEIRENARTYTDQVFKILDPVRTRVAFNSTWLAKLTFHDVIQLASKYNVGRMLERRDFRQRFEANRQIAIHEFLYPLMQGYDSVALEADVELGGLDQLFNLNAGRHIMEAYGTKPQCVLTVDLLVGLDGVDKMSKSKGNHVGVTEAPREMFGKIMSISDQLMWSWYPLLLDETPDPATTDPLEAKKMLAQTMVQRFVSPAAAVDTRRWWDAGRPAVDVRSVQVPGGPLFAVVSDAGAAKSRGEARKKIQQGGVSLNDERITDPHHTVAPGAYRLHVGKRFVVDIEVQDG